MPARMAGMTRLLLLLVFSVLLLPAPAQAWSAQGHRLVAALAEAQLSPRALSDVAMLLAGESDPTLPGVAIWADELRRSDADAFRRTASWHYVNFPSGTCTYRPERDCPGGNCVIGQIERQRTILADRSLPVAQRRDALKFLVHLVGDVHQPLHAGNRPDKGGNGFQVSLRTELKPEAHAQKDYVDGMMGTNLHSVWDYYLFASTRLSLSGYAARLGTQAGTRQAPIQSTDAAAWATESCKLIDAHRLYPKGHKLDLAYLDAQRPLAERQVVIAAGRLASLLNTTLVD